MPSMGYKLRRYRIHLVIAGLFLLFLVHLQYDSTSKQAVQVSDPLKEFENQLHQTVTFEQQLFETKDEEVNLNDYEILTTGGGYARVFRKFADLWPSVKVPRPQKFPVKDTIKLPTGDASSLGKVQVNLVEDDAAKKWRHDRREEVRAVMKIAWEQYKKYAWGFDEVRPVSLVGMNPFLGWAASMVDALDTLLIMGLKDEYKQAVEHVAKIDFTSTFREEIPMFETVIRYLGGLVAAYDLNNHQDTVLLDQAKVLADNLISAFDTPNRMPITFFKWRDGESKLKYTAGTDAVFAEVSSMSLEFTRLAQLTGNNSYYDAIARVTDAMYELAPKTGIPWLYPTQVDVSGCDLHIDNAKKLEDVTMGDIKGISKEDQKVIFKNNKYPDKIQHMKRDGDQSPPNKEDSGVPVLSPTGRGTFRRGHCLAKSMTKGQHAFPERYSFGGLADSGYEYYMKEFQLLKGGDVRYKEMYEKMVEAAKKNILYRPKVPTNEEILMLGTTTVRSDGERVKALEMQHLTCFAGGMFALGGKLLNRPDDVELGAKITRSCVWAYNSTRTGVMPESFSVHQECPGGLDFSVKCDANVELEVEEDTVDPQPNRRFSKPDITRVEDHKGGSRWGVFGHYDQPEPFARMDSKYQLRPEAIESMFYMHRVTGDPYWLEHGWNMFKSVRDLTAVRDVETGEVIGYSGVSDVTNDHDTSYVDVAESFWMGETLKYAYLLFDDFNHVSLDEYVFNTEAHPFKV